MRYIILISLLSSILLSDSCELDNNSINNVSYKTFIFTYCIDNYKYVSVNNSSLTQVFNASTVGAYPVECKCGDSNKDKK